MIEINTDTFQPLLTNTPDELVLEVQSMICDLVDNDRAERARRLAGLLVHMRPDSPDAWALFGKLLARANEHADALAALERAASISPERRDVMLEFGKALFRAGMPLQGLELIREVFLTGWDQRRAAHAQDPTTLEAGAIIESIQKMAAAIEGDTRQRS